MTLAELRQDLEPKLARIERDKGLLLGVLDTIINLFREEVGYTPQEILGQPPYRAPEAPVEPGDPHLEIARLKALVQRQDKIRDEAIAEVDRLERENQLLGDRLEELQKERGA